MTLPIHLALVSEIKEISSSDLTRVSAALQSQILRDFSPIWNVNASIDAFTSLDDVPVGYWPIIIETDIGTPGAAGVHENKDDGQPFALVQYSDSWSLTASHETLEMLADPSGNRLIGNPSPDDGKTPVQILIEVCDPSEDSQFSYNINGIMVSDFYTPHFFDAKKASSVQYSFTGAITEPRQVLKGGYISWREPDTGNWKQIQFFDAQPKVVDLGNLSSAGKEKENFRATIDSLMVRPELLRGVKARAKPLMASVAYQRAAEKPHLQRAKSMRAQIAAMKSKR
jgi:hypothetical protein